MTLSRYLVWVHFNGVSDAATRPAEAMICGKKSDKQIIAVHVDDQPTQTQTFVIPNYKFALNSIINSMSFDSRNHCLAEDWHI